MFAWLCFHNLIYIEPNIKINQIQTIQIAIAAMGMMSEPSWVDQIMNHNVFGLLNTNWAAKLEHFIWL